MLFHKATLKCCHLATVLFHKADRSFSPTSTVQNSLDNADACDAFHTRLYSAADSTTGHYNSAGMHSSTSLWLALSRQHTRESSTMRLHSTQHHKYALPWLPEIHWKSPKYECLYISVTQSGHYGVHIRGPPLHKYPFGVSLLSVLISCSEVR